MANIFYNLLTLYSKHRVLKKMYTTKHHANQTDSDFLGPILHLSGWNSATTAEFCASLTDNHNTNGTSLVSLSLGPSMAVNIFHGCLVSSKLFTGTRRFLAGMFTFLSMQPLVNRLRASGRNWFRTITMTLKKKQIRVFCNLCCIV